MGHYLPADPYLLSVNKKSISSGTVLLLCLFLLSGCIKENLCDCFHSTGSDIREDRDPHPISKIQLEGKIDLVLTQDTTEHIYVVGGKHLIGQIETSFGQDTLFIRNHNICNFVRTYNRRMTVYVSVHHLNDLLYNGAGEVSCTNTLRDSVLGVESRDGSGHVDLTLATSTSYATIHTGPADIRLRGSAPLMYVYSAGNGVIHTEGIQSEQIYLTNRGTGDLYVGSTASPSSILSLSLSAIGNVYCKGRPGTIQILNESGSGKLIIQ
jgi:hypothetical protein